MTERQVDRIAALLRERGPRGLTPLEALELAGTMRLASRIEELRSGAAAGLLRADEEIVTETAHANGKTFARYVLRRRQLVGATQPSLWE